CSRPPAGSPAPGASWAAARSSCSATRDAGPRGAGWCGPGTQVASRDGMTMLADTPTKPVLRGEATAAPAAGAQEARPAAGATRRIAVVSPSLWLTVTIEAGAGGPEVHLHAGGQGFWVARM